MTAKISEHISGKLSLLPVRLVRFFLRTITFSYSHFIKNYTTNMDELNYEIINNNQLTNERLKIYTEAKSKIHCFQKHTVQSLNPLEP